MSVSAPSENDRGVLRERLGDIPRQRLIEEIVARWDDIIRLEGEVANLRRRVREAELVVQSDRTDGSMVIELEEKLRIADSKLSRLERSAQNERVRREVAEADSNRLAELQEENVRLLRNEEELLLLVLDMEAQIDQLSKVE